MVSPAFAQDDRRDRRHGPALGRARDADDLAGKTVHVRRHRAIYDSLVALNGACKPAGKPEIKLVLVPMRSRTRT
jgi:hypothetical protein